MSNSRAQRFLRMLAGGVFAVATAIPLQADTITMGEPTVLSEYACCDDGLLVAQEAVLSQAATLRSVSFYVCGPSECGQPSEGQLRFGVYDATGPSGGPGVKKAETNEITPVEGWNTVNVVTPVALPAGTYWLAYAHTSPVLSYNVTFFSGAQSRYYSFTYGPLPATFSVTPSITDTRWSFYATLETETSNSLAPEDRLTTWNPGLPEGIPHRTVLCGPMIQAADFGNGTSDATAAIQSRLDNCGADQVVVLSAGEFMITSALKIKNLQNQGVVLRGQGPSGPNRTVLRMPLDTPSNVVSIGTHFYTTVQSKNLVADAVKGTMTAQLVDVMGLDPPLSAGEVLLIDQTTDPSITDWGARCLPGGNCRGWFSRYDRPTGQILEIDSVAGTMLTFKTPFHMTFKTANAAQLTRFAQWSSGPAQPPTKYAGLEDLAVSGGGSPTGGGNIWLTNAAYSWISNVESSDHEGNSIEIAASYRTVVRDSYIHSARNPTPSGAGYGIAVSHASSDNLIENNIVWNMNKVMVMQASGGGNVIGYNYMDDGWISYNPGWVEVGLNASHMTTPHYELFEGNVSFNFDGDNTWGNAVYITAFRNHLTGKRLSKSPLALTDEQNPRAIGLMRGHKWYTFVGNVLGNPWQGTPPRPDTLCNGAMYELLAPTSSWGNCEMAIPESERSPLPMWKMGYDPETWDTGDEEVVATLWRAGNYEYSTQSGEMRWEDAPPQPIPNSLYLSAVPAFFGSCAWPPFGGDRTPTIGTLPARARFTNNTPFDHGDPCP